MEKKRKRASFLKLLNDCLMVIFSMGAMAGRYLENPVHETMGLFFVLAVAIHGFQHLNWFKTMLLGRYGWRRILPFGIVFSLLFTAIILLAHGVMMSRTWFSFMEIKSTFTTRQVHTTAAYWVLILMGIHIGIHWTKVKGLLKKQIRFPQGFMWTRYFLRSLEFFILTAGILAFLERDVFSRLFMVYAFDFWNPELPAIRVLLSYLMVTSCFAVAAHRVWNSFGNRKIKFKIK